MDGQRPILGAVRQVNRQFSAAYDTPFSGKGEMKVEAIGSNQVGAPSTRPQRKPPDSASRATRAPCCPGWVATGWRRGSRRGLAQQFAFPQNLESFTGSPPPCVNCSPVVQSRQEIACFVNCDASAPGSGAALRRPIVTRKICDEHTNLSAGRGHGTPRVRSVDDCARPD